MRDGEEGRSEIFSKNNKHLGGYSGPKSIYLIQQWEIKIQTESFLLEMIKRRSDVH